MSVKNSIIEAYNYLSQDPSILSLLNLTGAPPQMIELRIQKTRQPEDIAGAYRRLGIWEGETKAYNRRVSQHFLNIDVVVTLKDQVNYGIALSLIEEIERVLRKKPIGRGLVYLGPLPDQPIQTGWYKATARFTYNAVS